jgi:hypothetical protein
MYTRFPSLIVKTGSAGGGSYDSDAQAFFTAAGITSTTEKDAWNTFVNSAKTNGYWSKFFALYPFLGSTSSACSYNAKNTATFQITWTGSLTFTSMGLVGHTSNSYGNTGFNINSSGWTNSSASFGCYSRTAPVNNTFNMLDNSTLNDAYIGTESGNASYAIMTQGSGGTFGTKLMIAQAESSNFSVLYRDASYSADATGTHIRNNVNMYLMGSSTQPSNSLNGIGFAFIGQTFTSGEITNFNTNINTLMTSLGRNV